MLYTVKIEGALEEVNKNSKINCAISEQTVFFFHFTICKLANKFEITVCHDAKHNKNTFTE